MTNVNKKYILHVPKKSMFTDIIYDAGVLVILFECLDKDKEIWIAEIRVEDNSLIGGAKYDYIEVKIEELSLPFEN